MIAFLHDSQCTIKRDLILFKILDPKGRKTQPPVCISFYLSFLFIVKINMIFGNWQIDSRYLRG